MSISLNPVVWELQVSQQPRILQVVSVAPHTSIIEGCMASPCGKSTTGALVGESTHTDAAHSELEDARAGVGIRSIEPANGDGGRVTLITDAGDEAAYDAVILATHADISLKMLGGSCPQVGLCACGRVSSSLTSWQAWRMAQSHKLCVRACTCLVSTACLTTSFSLPTRLREFQQAAEWQRASDLCKPASNEPAAAARRPCGRCWRRAPTATTTCTCTRTRR